MTFLVPNLPGTWRGSPFLKGARYRVLQPAPSYQGRLTVGEVLTYFGASYGHYFGESVYVFTNDEGEERTWLLPDAESLDDWSRIFIAATDAG